MFLRFYRRVSLFPGLRVNLSCSGASVSVGRRGSWLTVGPRGRRMTAGIPGTGLFWTQTCPPAPAPHGAIAKRLVGYLERARYVVMKCPPLIPVASSVFEARGQQTLPTTDHLQRPPKSLLQLWRDHLLGRFPRRGLGYTGLQAK
jgi:Protein of unknown function (DUF4236)